MKNYRVIDHEGKFLASFIDKKQAKLYAKEEAIRLTNSISVDLWDDTCGKYQYMETVANFDPMGKLLE